MLNNAELSQIKVSVSERALRQRWRENLLWVLRALMLVFVALILALVFRRPFADVGPVMDRCVELGAAPQVRSCLRDAVEVRRRAVQDVRDDVVSLIALLGLTITLAFLTRHGLREQLREQGRFSEQVFDSVPMPMSLRSPSGYFLRVNAAFEKRHGLKLKNIIGHPYSDYFPQRVCDEVARLDALAIASTGPIEEEFDLSRDGKPEHFVIGLQAVRDEDGAVIGIVMLRDDITGLRVNQAELSASNDRLRRLSAQMIDAQERERRRIARDLHDQVGQILTALKLQLGSLVKRGSIADAHDALTLPIEFAEEALRHTRDLSASLHPHLLDDLGLEPALRWLVERFIRPLVPTMDLRFRLDPVRGPQDIERVAFRVVQEALTNVVRHAQATRIGVILEAADGRLAIEVIDDGVGFETSGEPSLGLAGMHERVADFGGELQMESTPGAGTSVRAKLPWTRT
jgi:two-component system, NarL family, sensor histidine kinase UhpB